MGRLANPRRWLQFTFRSFIFVLTIGCVWLGWKVERARERGQAIDAIIAAGGRVTYEDRRLMANRSWYTNPANHFWLDLRDIPVSISIHDPLNGKIRLCMPHIHGITDLEIVGRVFDADFNDFERLQGNCKVIIEGDKLVSESAIERIRRELPHLTILWVKGASPPQ